MPAPRNRRHLLVPTPATTEAYTPHARKIEPAAFNRPADRRAHAANLRNALEGVVREAHEIRQDLGTSVEGAQPGLYIQFESPPDAELKLESLEDRRKGVELLTVQAVSIGTGGRTVQLATVFVPDGQVKHFFERLRQYANETTAKGEPRHKEMIDRIAALRRATLRALWTDSPDSYPDDAQTIWWELWLRRHDGRELQRFLEFAVQRDLTVGERRLAFDDRLVLLVRGTVRQLSASVDLLSDMAEIRRAKQSAAFFIDASPPEQLAWVDDLRLRITLPLPDAPAVCVLDTGITRGHPLLVDLIAPEDASAVDPNWGSQDDGGGPTNMGHGTEMAGLAAYGDLTEPLASRSPFRLKNRLESVKILPPTGANLPELYGAITAQAVARPEITAPDRRRVFSLSVTATDERDRGQPTSWSAAIDALATGRTFDPASQGLAYLDDFEVRNQRLFVVSAGNVASDRLERAHLNRSDLEAVHDPAQAWNALTVGAFTEKVNLQHPDWAGWTPLSRAGDLSPWSTTSVTFREIWPVKPDVVFEGGNVACNGSDFDWPVPDLCLLSTFYKPNDKLLVSAFATSAATAQVAHIAGNIQAEYPGFWPETLRALVIHSARWTRTMERHLRGAAGRRARASLVRRYGFGVPDGDRALRSANDSLTLVVQSALRPFADGKMKEMHLHELPWPKEVLEELGETPVRLRVTLSYFVEPNPGRRGWKKRHRYASHGLRFEVKSPTESVDDLRKRLNLLALDEDEERPATGTNANGWFLGEQTRNKGSVHSDIWVGTAADLAERNVVGVYPVSGWWKDQPKRDRSSVGARYALVLSIDTEAQGVDIWTPVATSIGIQVEEIGIE